MGVLDTVPDLIREVATEDGVVNAGKENSLGLYGTMTPELKRAYANGDYNTIDKLTQTVAKDLNPILENIRRSQRQAFFRVINPSDKVEYYMSIAGPTNRPYGYMWVYVSDTAKKSGSGDSTEGDPPSQPVIQYGQYSSNGKTLWISNQLWANKPLEITLGVAALIFTEVASRYIFIRIQRTLLNRAAAELAAREGGQALVEAGVIRVGLWRTMSNLVVSHVLGAVVGAAAYYLVLFIIDFIFKEFKIGVTVYNWDIQRTYTITAVFCDNAKLDGGDTFASVTLPPGSNSFTAPDGQIIPTPDTIFANAGLVYQNVSTGFQGLGVALRIVADDGNAFQTKYVCRFAKSNLLGIGGGTSQSLQSYYNDSGAWAPSGSLKAESTIPGNNVPVICTTLRLNGSKDDLYQFDVSIGIKPSDKFGDPGEAPPDQSPLIPAPEQPTTPSVGETIVLPNGKEVKVAEALIVGT